MGYKLFLPHYSNLAINLANQTFELEYKFSIEIPNDGHNEQGESINAIDQERFQTYHFSFISPECGPVKSLWITISRIKFIET